MGPVSWFLEIWDTHSLWQFYDDTCSFCGIFFFTPGYEMAFFQREQSQFTGWDEAYFQTNPSPWMDRPPTATPAGHGCWIQNSLHLDRNIWSCTQTELVFTCIYMYLPCWLPAQHTFQILPVWLTRTLNDHLLGSATARHSARFSCHPQQQKSKLPNPTDRTWQVLLRTSERYRETPEIKGSQKIWANILDHLGTLGLGIPLRGVKWVSENCWFQPTCFRCFQAHGAVSFSRTSLSRCIMSCCGHNVGAGTYDVLMMSLCPRFSWCGWANL